MKYFDFVHCKYAAELFHSAMWGSAIFNLVFVTTILNTPKMIYLHDDVWYDSCLFEILLSFYDSGSEFSFWWNIAMSTRILQFIILNNVFVENSMSDPANYLHLHLQDRKGGRFWWMPLSWRFNIGTAPGNKGDLKNQESQNLVGSRPTQNGRFIQNTFFTNRTFDPST